MTSKATIDREKNGGLIDYQPPCKPASGFAGGAILADDSPAKVLCSGIDTLYLTVDVEWIPTAAKPGGEQTTQWFKRLHDDKRRAANEHGNVFPDVLRVDDFPAWQFNVSSYGMGGYSFMLASRFMTWKLGDWMQPSSRPSILIEFRSETLWTFGVLECMRWTRLLIEAMGGIVKTMKPSRVDMCVDVLIRADDWCTGITEKTVTRTRDFQVYMQHRQLTGLGFGGKSAKIKCRMYDKPKEIARASGKYWMYDVWGIRQDELTDDYRIIRVEFQLMREKIKELGMDNMVDLRNKQDQCWSYLTRKWLLVVTRVDKRDRRSDAAWWKAVQRGYRGSQLACPLIPAKAVKRDVRQLKAQFDGMLVSILACHQTDIEDGQPITMREALRWVAENFRKGLDDDISDLVKGRLAKYARAEMKIQEAMNHQAYRPVQIQRDSPEIPPIEPMTADQLYLELMQKIDETSGRLEVPDRPSGSGK